MLSMIQHIRDNKVGCLKFTNFREALGFKIQESERFEILICLATSS